MDPDHVREDILLFSFSSGGRVVTADVDCRAFHVGRRETDQIKSCHGQVEWMTGDKRRRRRVLTPASH